MEAPVETASRIPGAVRKKVETVGLVLIAAGTAPFLLGLLVRFVPLGERVFFEFGWPLAIYASWVGWGLVLAGAVLFVGSLVRIPLSGR